MLFINADREYKEGKNQNSLRPEDIEKITHVYHDRLEVKKYSDRIPVAELEQEDFNLNIRRYVDNSPPPEPHDVRAHMHGGVPVDEVGALGGYWANYPGLREKLFVARGGNTAYADFAASLLADKSAIKALIEGDSSVTATNAKLGHALAAWWAANVGELQQLPAQGSFVPMRKKFAQSLEDALVPLGMLDKFQVRGAFAEFVSNLVADFKSVGASGWNAELIPADEILAAQFPEVLAELEKAGARIA